MNEEAARAWDEEGAFWVEHESQYNVGVGVTTRGMLEGLDDDARRAALENLRRAVDDHRSPDGVGFGSRAYLITAYRA